MKFGLPSLKLVVIFALASASFISNITWVAAQSSQSTPIKSSPQPQPSTPASSQGTIHVVLPELPPGPPPGGRRYGGARRQEQCTSVTRPLTALAPLKKQPASVINIWGWTTQEHPKLWFYLPYTQSSTYVSEFVLLDDESKDSLYKTAIALPNQPGIVSVALPKSLPPLQVGKKYRWFLNIYCNQQKQSIPIYVEGVILRQELNQALVKQLQKAQPLQQVAIYASNGFWHDALDTLAELHQKYPHNRTFQLEWKNLLQAIGLSELATEPLISSSDNENRTAKPLHSFYLQATAL